MLVDDKGLHNLAGFTSIKVDQYEVKFKLGGDSYTLDTEAYLASEAIVRAIMAHNDGRVYSRYDFLEAINLARHLDPAPDSALYLPNYWAAIARESLPAELGAVKAALGPYPRTRGFMLVREHVAWNFYKEPFSMGLQVLTPCCNANLVPKRWEGPGYRVGSCLKCGKYIWDGGDVETADLYHEQPRRDWLEAVLTDVHGLDPLTATIEATLVSENSTVFAGALTGIYKNAMTSPW